MTRRRRRRRRTQKSQRPRRDLAPCEKLRSPPQIPPSLTPGEIPDPRRTRVNAPGRGKRGVNFPTFTFLPEKQVFSWHAEVLTVRSATGPILAALTSEGRLRMRELH